MAISMQNTSIWQQNKWDNICATMNTIIIVKRAFHSFYLKRPMLRYLRFSLWVVNVCNAWQMNDKKEIRTSLFIGISTQWKLSLFIWFYARERVKTTADERIKRAHLFLSVKVMKNPQDIRTLKRKKNIFNSSNRLHCFKVSISHTSGSFEHRQPVNTPFCYQFCDTFYWISCRKKNTRKYFQRQKNLLNFFSRILTWQTPRAVG